MEPAMPLRTTPLRTARSFAAGLLAGLVCAGAAPALAQGSPPDLSAVNIGWIAVGTEWTAVPGGPQPVKQDPAHRYVPNNVGGQPTFLIADISNPILQLWARDALMKRNEVVLSGKAGYTRDVSCWPLGVPGFRTRHDPDHVSAKGARSQIREGSRYGEGRRTARIRARAASYSQCDSGVYLVRGPVRRPHLRE